MGLLHLALCMHDRGKVRDILGDVGANGRWQGGTFGARRILRGPRPLLNCIGGKQGAVAGETACLTCGCLWLRADGPG